MTETFAITVTRVQGDEADLEVTIIHPDLTVVPCKKAFALRLLFEPLSPYSPYSMEPSLQRSPAAQEVDLEDFADRAFWNLNAQGFIKQISYGTQLDHPPPYPGEPDYEAFYQQGRRPRATLRIQVTHPGWLAHLREGMSWSTDAYDLRDGRPWCNRPTRSPGDYIEQISDDPMQGMLRAQLHDRVRALFEPPDAPQVSAYILPLLWSKQYTTKGQELRDALLCPENLTPMLGQPVLAKGFGAATVGALLHVDPVNQRIQLCRIERDGRLSAPKLYLNQLIAVGRAWHKERVYLWDVEV